MRRVYFIKPVGMDGPIKIGCSQSPTLRKEGLETWSPFPLEIIAEIEGGFALERRFHARHAASHKGHEWFHVTLELLLDIRAIQEGRFDIEALPPPKKIWSKGGGKPRGAVWSPEKKAAQARQRAFRNIAKQTGLHCPFEHSDPRADEYLADPHKFGVPYELWVARRYRVWNENRLRLIEKERTDIEAQMRLLAQDDAA